MREVGEKSRGSWSRKTRKKAWAQREIHERELDKQKKRNRQGCSREEKQ